MNLVIPSIALALGAGTSIVYAAAESSVAPAAEAACCTCGQESCAECRGKQPAERVVVKERSVVKQQQAERALHEESLARRVKENLHAHLAQLHEHEARAHEQEARLREHEERLHEHQERLHEHEAVSKEMAALGAELARAFSDPDANVHIRGYVGEDEGEWRAVVKQALAQVHEHEALQGEHHAEALAQAKRALALAHEHKARAGQRRDGEQARAEAALRSAQEQAGSWRARVEQIHAEREHRGAAAPRASGADEYTRSLERRIEELERKLGQRNEPLFPAAPAAPRAPRAPRAPKAPKAPIAPQAFTFEKPAKPHAPQPSGGTVWSWSSEDGNLFSSDSEGPNVFLTDDQRILIRDGEEQFEIDLAELGDLNLGTSTGNVQFFNPDHESEDVFVISGSDGEGSCSVNVSGGRIHVSTPGEPGQVHKVVIGHAAGQGGSSVRVVVPEDGHHGVTRTRIECDGDVTSPDSCGESDAREECDTRSECDDSQYLDRDANELYFAPQDVQDSQVLWSTPDADAGLPLRAAPPALLPTAASPRLFPTASGRTGAAGAAQPSPELRDAVREMRSEVQELRETLRALRTEVESEPTGQQR